MIAHGGTIGARCRRRLLPLQLSSLDVGGMHCSSKGASSGNLSRTNHVLDALTAGPVVLAGVLGNGEAAAGQLLSSCWVLYSW